MIPNTLHISKSDFLKSMESISGSLSEETGKKIADIFDKKNTGLQEIAQHLSSNTSDEVLLRFDMINYMTSSFELFLAALEVMPQEKLGVTTENTVYDIMMRCLSLKERNYPALNILTKSEKKQMIATAVHAYQTNSQK